MPSNQTATPYRQLDPQAFHNITTPHIQTTTATTTHENSVFATTTIITTTRPHRLVHSHQFFSFKKKANCIISCHCSAASSEPADIITAQCPMGGGVIKETCHARLPGEILNQRGVWMGKHGKEEERLGPPTSEGTRRLYILTRGVVYCGRTRCVIGTSMTIGLDGHVPPRIPNNEWDGRVGYCFRSRYNWNCLIHQHNYLLSRGLGLLVSGTPYAITSQGTFKSRVAPWECEDRPSTA